MRGWCAWPSASGCAVSSPWTAVTFKFIARPKSAASPSFPLDRNFHCIHFVCRNSRNGCKAALTVQISSRSLGQLKKHEPKEVSKRACQCPRQEVSDKAFPKTPNQKLRPLQTPVRAVCELYPDETPTARIVKKDDVCHIDQEIDQNRL